MSQRDTHVEYRVRNAISRCNRARAVAPADESAAFRGKDGRLRVGDVVLEPSAALVRVPGRTVMLTTQELRLLALLMERADHFVRREEILDRLWGPDFAGDPGTLTVHMMRLRTKLERHAGAARHLRTIRGVGYIFDTDPVPRDATAHGGPNRSDGRK